MNQREVAEAAEMKAKFGVWEKHAQTIMLMVVTTTLMFTGNFMWKVNGQLAEMASENKHLAFQLAELRGQIAGMQATYITRPEFTSYTERLRNLEAKK
jgi:hypothetical protein